MILNGHRIHEKCWFVKHGKIQCLDHRCDSYDLGYDRKINSKVVHIDFGCFDAYFLEKYCHGQLPENYEGGY
jgi:hypothetical protein